MTQVATGGTRKSTPPKKTPPRKRSGGSRRTGDPKAGEPRSAGPERAAAGKPADDPPEDATEAVMGLDMILVDGARGPLRRLVPPARTTLRFARALAGKPDAVTRHSGEFVRELGRIGAGRSEVAANPKDKRFADPAWTGNPLLRRLMQAHIAGAQLAARLVDDADLDWQD